MGKKPTYEKLEHRVNELEKELAERKRAEEEASFERDLLQTLLNNIPDYIYFKDRDRRFVIASSLFCDLFHRNMEDIIGKKDEDLFPEKVAEKTVRDDRQVIETGKPIINREEGGESIGGEKPWVLTTKVPWYDREGNIMGLFGVSKDITDRKRAEEALRESEETTKALLNAPSDTSMLIDTKGTILAINKTGAQRLGKGVNGLVGLSINQYLPEGLARKRLEEGEKVLRSGRPVHFEDEREGRYFENSIYPTFGKEGNVSRLAVFARDITYRKQKEEERENLICKLQDALDDVKTLSGMLPICASCNKIRDDKGYWNQIESYIRDHSEAVFSHSICPECAKILYPELTIHE